MFLHSNIKNEDGERGLVEEKFFLRSRVRFRYTSTKVERSSRLETTETFQSIN